MTKPVQYPCIPAIRAALARGDVDGAINALNEGWDRGAPDRVRGEALVWHGLVNLGVIVPRS